MKSKILFVTLLAIALVFVACVPAPTPVPPTPPPPPTVAPTAIPPTPVPPTATPVPPTATPKPPTATPVPPTLAPTPNPHVAGANCIACHPEQHKRWATTLHAASAADVLTNVEHNTAELLTDECVTCHAPFQAAKFKIADFVQPVDQKGPWKVVDKNAKMWEAIKCEVCHDPTSKAPRKLAFYDPEKQAYVAVSGDTELCEKCHQPGTDDSRDLAGSVHQGLNCAYCHFQKGTSMSLDPHESCAQCHPHAGNPKHPDVTQLDTTYKDKDSKNDIHFVSCATCHPKGLPTPTGK